MNTFLLVLLIIETLIMIGVLRYRSTNSDGVINIMDAGDKIVISLDLDTDPEPQDIAKKKRVVFRVNNTPS